MYITADTLDDLLHRVLEKLLKSKIRVQASRGATVEQGGVLLRLSNPLARLSRSESKRVLFSCIGELLWYLAGSSDLSFIKHYLSRYADESEDGKTIHGAYGPRLFKMRGVDQVANVLDLLRRKPNSRRAVIQLFGAEDLSRDHIEIPCTCTLQFMVRDSRLDLLVSMRSNDAFVGLPHDIFAFTMMQEIFACSLGLKLGVYKHVVGSLHLYEKDRKRASAYLSEGWQETIAMPPMPSGDPWPALQEIKNTERRLRRGTSLPAPQKLQPYWMDLIRLLMVFDAFKRENARQIGVLKRQMSVQIFDPYITQKQRAARRGKASRAARVDRA